MSGPHRPCGSPALSRRQALRQGSAVALLLAGLGLGPAALAYNAAAFDAHSLAQAYRALGLPLPQAAREVTLTAPDIAENGASVLLGLAATLPGVRQMLLLVDKNPAVLAAAFQVSDGVESSFSMRVKLAQSTDVYAVAVLADGRCLFARREVRVTLGGCG